MKNTLDLTDPKVRRELGISKKDITSSSDYSKTQVIGKWAKGKGYDGIIAPSARDSGGTNIVIF